MSLSKTCDRFNVQADIHYWPPGVGCLYAHDTEAADKKLGNTYDGTRTMLITDIREKEDEYNIEEHGFTVLTVPERKRWEYDDHWVVNNLYKEYESLIQALTGADVVCFFNHVQRRAGETIWNPALKDAYKNGPSSYPHVDYCSDKAMVDNFIKKIAARFFPPEVASKWETASRTALFNAWKPIETVQRDPLTVGNCQSFKDKDFRLCINVLPDGSKHGNYVIAPEEADPKHNWCYIHHQTPVEVLVFRVYDSDRSTPGWRCPHTAFRVPGSEHLPARQSIEARGIALWF